MRPSAGRITLTPTGENPHAYLGRLPEHSSNQDLDLLKNPFPTCFSILEIQDAPKGVVPLSGRRNLVKLVHSVSSGSGRRKNE